MARIRVYSVWQRASHARRHADYWPCSQRDGRSGCWPVGSSCSSPQSCSKYSERAVEGGRRTKESAAVRMARFRGPCSVRLRSPPLPPSEPFGGRVASPVGEGLGVRAGTWVAEPTKPRHGVPRSDRARQPSARQTTSLPGRPCPFRRRTNWQTGHLPPQSWGAQGKSWFRQGGCRQPPTNQRRQTEGAAGGVWILVDHVSSRASRSRTPLLGSFIRRPAAAEPSRATG